MNELQSLEYYYDKFKDYNIPKYKISLMYSAIKNRHNNNDDVINLNIDCDNDNDNNNDDDSASSDCQCFKPCICCYNCYNCSGCIGCINCTDCKNCENCYIKCKKCEKCINCRGWENYDNYDIWDYMSNCKYCNNCEGSYYCVKCYNCNHCCEWTNVEDGSESYYARNYSIIENKYDINDTKNKYTLHIHNNLKNNIKSTKLNSFLANSSELYKGFKEEGLDTTDDLNIIINLKDFEEFNKINDIYKLDDLITTIIILYGDIGDNEFINDIIYNINYLQIKEAIEVLAKYNIINYH